MIAITYILITGTGLHRAPSASAAMEIIRTVRQGGGTIVKIVVTATGKTITEQQLAGLAERES